MGTKLIFAILSALFLMHFLFKRLVLFGLPVGCKKLFNSSGFMSAESVLLSSGVIDSRRFEGTVYFLDAFLRNIGNKWLCYSASQPNRLASSISTLWKPRFSVPSVSWLTISCSNLWYFPSSFWITLWWYRRTCSGAVQYIHKCLRRHTWAVWITPFQWRQNGLHFKSPGDCTLLLSDTDALRHGCAVRIHRGKSD
jgi:hypothetical protein